jgi:pyruvate formate lyase activating enzyme
MISPKQSLSPVYAYLKRPSMIDFPGKLAVVMFSTGCNFACGFCHNATLMGKPKEGLAWDKLSKACDEFKEQWVDAVVISGGEPTLDPDGLAELIDFLKQRGFAVKLDTNGSRPDVLESVLPHIDYVAMDVKISLPKYKDFVGFGDTDKIRRSVELIRDSGVRHEFRTTVIEGVHDEADIRQIATLINGADRYVLQPFLPHEDLPHPKFRETPRTSPAFMKKMEQAAAQCAKEVLARGK